jgi:CRP-like cAMP-binding protein
MTVAKFDSALARQLNSFIELSKDELLILVDLQSKSRKVKHGQELTEEGGVGTTAFILQSGWTCSYKVLPCGALRRRSIRRLR